MRRTLLHAGVLAAVAAMVLAGCGSNPAPAPPDTRADGPAAQPAVAPTLSAGHPAWISVSVATLWRSPRSPRPVDAPALANPARIGTWLSDMTLDERRALNGRADTQALFGDRVRVVRLRTKWAKVVVPSQPTPLDSRGYPGWVPRRQLTAERPAAADQQATVVDRLAWLRTDQANPTRVIRVSFGTRLPVIEEGDGYVRVSAPGGVVRRLAASAVVVHATGTPAKPQTRRALVRSAKTFLGLPYLWAGRSGYGLDCSGLTSLVYRASGVTIPRDASPQSKSGTEVNSPRRSDLMFYATGGVVHHVSMYVGDGKMIHSPSTGSTVHVVPTSTLSDEYAGARRYLP